MLVHHPVHNIKGIKQSKHFEIQKTNTDPQLIPQGQSLAFVLWASIEGHAVMGTRDGDERQGAEILNACHPWDIVGPREYEVSIIIEEHVCATAQKANDLEEDFGCYSNFNATKLQPKTINSCILLAKRSHYTYMTDSKIW